MKDKIHGLLVSAISDLYESKDLSIEIVKTKSEEHGDWSSNIAMIEAKKRMSFFWYNVKYCNIVIGTFLLA